MTGPMVCKRSHIVEVSSDEGDGEITTTESQDLHPSTRPPAEQPSSSSSKQQRSSLACADTRTNHSTRKHGQKQRIVQNERGETPLRQSPLNLGKSSNKLQSKKQTISSTKVGRPIPAKLKAVRRSTSKRTKRAQSKGDRRETKRKYCTAASELRLFVKHGIKYGFFTKLLIPSDLMALIMLLEALLQKHWNIYPAAIVFLVCHRLRVPATSRRISDLAPTNIQYISEAVCWIRSVKQEVDFTKSPHWIGRTQFHCNPKVVDTWLAPEHEATLSAAAHSMCNILFGRQTVEAAKAVVCRMPHNSDYAYHCIRAFGDAIAYLSHIKVYPSIRLPVVLARFRSKACAASMSPHVSVLNELLQPLTLKYPDTDAFKASGKTGRLRPGDLVCST